MRPDTPPSRVSRPADMMGLLVEPQQCTGWSSHPASRLAVRMYDFKVGEGWHYVVVISSSYLTSDWTRTLNESDRTRRSDQKDRIRSYFDKTILNQNDRLTRPNWTLKGTDQIRMSRPDSILYVRLELFYWR